MTDRERLNHLDQENRFLLAEKNRQFARAQSLEQALTAAQAANLAARTLIEHLYEAYHAHGGEGQPWPELWDQVRAGLESSPTWPSVLRFARQMEAKLEANRHKGNRRHWLMSEPHWLFDRLVEESKELKREILVGDVRMQETLNARYHAEGLTREAADVANYAMMLADWHMARAGVW